MNNIKSVQITVSGRVQNVGFRYATYEKAIEIGITGFVMNQPDGSVYIEAEGTENLLDEFIIWCHNGPNWAKVLDVKIGKQPICNFSTFKIKR
ncbi:MAG: acylphosphatase [Salinivirgaceae bacterium]|nr:acylphosphatase [Salinivirgaceae bacterium]